MQDANHDEKPVLSASALKIYVCLLKRNPRALSSGEIRELTNMPKSTVHYSLKALVVGGLVDEVAGAYAVKEVVKVGVLKQCIYVFGKLLPRYVIFATIFVVTMLLSALTFFMPEIKVIVLVACVIGFLWAMRMVRKFRVE